MSNRINRINATIDNHIYVWSSVPFFCADGRNPQERPRYPRGKAPGPHRARSPQRRQPKRRRPSVSINFALERMAGQITSEHFTIFRDAETVEVILEDSYGIQCRTDRDDILIPHQNEAIKIIIQCLFHRAKAADEKDMLCFLHMFSRAKPQVRPDQDRTMRLRSMIWFIYLAIEIVKTEPEVCSKGLEYFRNKFRELLDRTIDGTIIRRRIQAPGVRGRQMGKNPFRLAPGGRPEGIRHKAQTPVQHGQQDRACQQVPFGRSQKEHTGTGNGYVLQIGTRGPSRANRFCA